MQTFNCRGNLSLLWNEKRFGKQLENVFAILSALQIREQYAETYREKRLKVYQAQLELTKINLFKNTLTEEENEILTVKQKQSSSVLTVRLTVRDPTVNLNY